MLAKATTVGFAQIDNWQMLAEEVQVPGSIRMPSRLTTYERPALNRILRSMAQRNKQYQTVELLARIYSCSSKFDPERLGKKSM